MRLRWCLYLRIRSMIYTLCDSFLYALWFVLVGSLCDSFLYALWSLYDSLLLVRVVIRSCTLCDSFLYALWFVLVRFMIRSCTLCDSFLYALCLTVTYDRFIARYVIVTWLKYYLWQKQLSVYLFVIIFNTIGTASHLS